MGKVILILGIIGILLGGGVTLVSLFLPAMTRNVSREEATIGIIAGIVVLVGAFIVAGIGLIILLAQRKKVG